MHQIWLEHDPGHRSDKDAAPSVHWITLCIAKALFPHQWELCSSSSMLLLATKLSVLIQLLSQQSCAFVLCGLSQNHTFSFLDSKNIPRPSLYFLSPLFPMLGFIYSFPLLQRVLYYFYPPFSPWSCRSPHTFPSSSKNLESILLSLTNPSTHPCGLNPFMRLLSIVPSATTCPLQHSPGSSIKAKLPPFVFPPLPWGTGFCQLGWGWEPCFSGYFYLYGLSLYLLVSKLAWTLEGRGEEEGISLRTSPQLDMVTNEQMQKCSVGTSLL